MGYVYDDYTGKNYWVDDKDPMNVKEVKWTGEPGNLKETQVSGGSSSKKSSGTTIYTPDKVIEELKNQVSKLVEQVRTLMGGQQATGVEGLGFGKTGYSDDWGDWAHHIGDPVDVTPYTPPGISNLSDLLGGNMGLGPTTGTQTEEVYSPYTSYLQALGLGDQSYYNPAQQYMMRQYMPLSTIYDVRRRMATDNPSYNPGDYLGQWASNTWNDTTGLAKNTLADILGMGQEQRATLGLDFSPYFTGTDNVGTSNLGWLQDLIGTGVRGNLGNWLSSQIAPAQQQWGNYQAGGGSDTFLDYFKKKYNLESLIG